VPLKRRGLCTITGKLAVEGCKVVGAPFVPGTEPRGVCTRDHSEDFVEKEEGEAPAHEGLWKRLAREKAEREAAAGLAPEGEAPPPAVAPPAAPEEH
jgi:hypothetical protein